jgi:hypothetical protein
VDSKQLYRPLLLVSRGRWEMSSGNVCLKVREQLLFLPLLYVSRSLLLFLLGYRFRTLHMITSSLLSDW